MSLMDAPMALVDRILRRPPVVPPDEPLARMLERLAHDLEPDPLYRRQLRGETLNRYVAAREGMDLPARARAGARRMTPIGRAVLFTSVVMAAGAASVSATSQTAMPGDALYPLKLRIEELRIEVAPGDLKDELVVASLDARLAEIRILADRGDWAAAQGVAAQATVIAAALESMVPRTSPAAEIALSHDVAVLEAIVADAPAAAVPALQRALEASSHAASVVKANGWRAPDAPVPPGQATESEEPSSPRPTATPRPGNDAGSDHRGGPGSTNGGGPGSTNGGGASNRPTPSEAPANVGDATEDGAQESAAPEASKSPRPAPPGPASTPRGG